MQYILLTKNLIIYLHEILNVASVISATFISQFEYFNYIILVFSSIHNLIDVELYFGTFHSSCYLLENFEK